MGDFRLSPRALQQAAKDRTADPKTSKN